MHDVGGAARTPSHLVHLKGEARYSPASTIGVIGEGTFAVVHQVRDMVANQPVAVKTVRKALCERFPGLDVAIDMEIKLMQRVGRHPHIVGLIDEYETPSAWHLVLELATGGQVFDRLADTGAFSEWKASTLVRQVGQALQHVHAANVCHRDVKPENLVYLTDEPDANVLLCDFGVSLSVEPGSLLRGQRGTQAYMAPEMLDDQGYTQAVDLWSLGVLLYSLLSGSHPFDPYGDLTDDEIYERVRSFSWDAAFTHDGPWKHVSPEAKEVVQGLMEWDPSKRWTADRLLESPWVCGFATSTLLPGSDRRLLSFNASRATWRAAILAAAFVGGASGYSPRLAAAFWAGPSEQMHSDPSIGHSRSIVEDCLATELGAAYEAYAARRGTVNIRELRLVLESLGEGKTTASGMIGGALRDLDNDAGVVLEFDAFCGAMSSMYGACRQALRRSFDIFDWCGSGTMRRSRLNLLLAKLNLEVGPKEKAFLTSLTDDDDDEGGGRVSFEEFLAIFGRCRIRDADVTMDYAVSVAVSAQSPHATGATILGDSHTALRSLVDR